MVIYSAGDKESVTRSVTARLYLGRRVQRAKRWAEFESRKVAAEKLGMADGWKCNSRD